MWLHTTCRFALAAVLGATLPGTLAGQGTVVTDTVFSPGLVSNIVGDSPNRRVLVYLPPSYRAEPSRRYPVLYLLHGATSLPEEWLDGSYQGFDLRKAMDSLVLTKAIPEFIVVMPDADNALGAGFYANSPPMGNWEDFVVRDLVRHVDGRYRTDTVSARRALVGHSMGGFGALAIGFKYPGIFGLVYAISPCCLAFVGRFDPSSPAWPMLANLRRWQDAPGQVRTVLGMTAALDGNRTSPRMFDELPFTAGSGGVMSPNERAQARWLARMPSDLASAMVRRGDHQPLLLVEAGSEETGLLDGIRLLRARLDSLGVRYADTTFTGGHVDRVRERFTRHILPNVGEWFSHPPARRDGSGR